MLIDPYYSQTGNEVSFTRQQSSDFAKKIADDFNPIHDIDSKRFCVPGDLLFSLILAKYGVTKHMRFAFKGMVTEDIALILPEEAEQFSISSDAGREYMNIGHSGENSTNEQLIDNLTRSYVTFSGHTFPHILVPIMKEKGVMINPERPMVMYQSMLLDLDYLDKTDITLELDNEKTVFELNGRRGNLCLAFNLTSDKKIIGRGEKHMIVSGLKPYEEDVVSTVVDDYALWKKIYTR